MVWVSACGSESEYYERYIDINIYAGSVADNSVLTSEYENNMHVLLIH